MKIDLQHPCLFASLAMSSLLVGTPASAQIVPDPPDASQTAPVEKAPAETEQAVPESDGARLQVGDQESMPAGVELIVDDPADESAPESVPAQKNAPVKQEKDTRVRPRPQRMPPPPRQTLRERLGDKVKPVVGKGTRWRLELGAGWGREFIKNDSFRSFGYGGGTQARVSARVGFSFGLGSARRVSLGPVLGWEYGESRGDLQGAAYQSTRLDTHDLSAGLRASIVTIEGIDIYGELRGGVSTGSAYVYVDAPNINGNVDYTVGLVRGSLGVSLYAPRAWLPRKGGARVTGGLDIGASYGLRGDIDVELKRYGDRESDEFNDAELSGIEPIPTQTPDLGTLELRGLQWRVALFVRFM